MLGAEGCPRLSRHLRRGPRGRALLRGKPRVALRRAVTARAREAGATRVSVGVQSFDDRELRGSGCVHDALLARDRAAAAVDSGPDVSLDLMCGIPFRHLKAGALLAVQAVELGVGHVSCYPTIEPGTLLERIKSPASCPALDDTEADDMEAALEVLGQAGFFALRGRKLCRPQRCAHNVRYWTGVEHLGFARQPRACQSRFPPGSLRERCPRSLRQSTTPCALGQCICSTTDELVCATSLASSLFEVRAAE